MPPPADRPMVIATRGSALALAQAHAVLDQCRQIFPRLRFELKILKTTGDKLQTAALAREGSDLPKGLFTKELEVALVQRQADLAVHSLKDLPTELPAGLELAAVPQRADARDVLIYRDETAKNEPAQAPGQEWAPGQSPRRGFAPGLAVMTAPPGLVIGTSSTRRQAQLQLLRDDFKFIAVRGNVVTRLEKLAQMPELDALILAAAGLARLNFLIDPEGWLRGDAVPDGLRAVILPLETMLPCVGQGALGIEMRADDERLGLICQRLNHYNSHQCVLAERAFLRGMGGGCQSPVAAYAEVVDDKLWLRAMSLRDEGARRAEIKGALTEAEGLGVAVAKELK